MQPNADESYDMNPFRSGSVVSPSCQKSQAGPSARPHNFSELEPRIEAVRKEYGISQYTTRNLEKLGDYHTVIIVDDSKSMQFARDANNRAKEGELTLWDEARERVTGMVNIAAPIAPLDLFFLNDPSFNRKGLQKNDPRLEAVFARQPFVENTPLTDTLENVIANYSESGNTIKKPLNILIMTDGCPSMTDGYPKTKCHRTVTIQPDKDGELYSRLEYYLPASRKRQLFDPNNAANISVKRDDGNDKYTLSQGEHHWDITGSPFCFKPCRDRLQRELDSRDRFTRALRAAKIDGMGVSLHLATRNEEVIEAYNGVREHGIGVMGNYEDEKKNDVRPNRGNEAAETFSKGDYYAKCLLSGIPKEAHQLARRDAKLQEMQNQGLVQTNDAARTQREEARGRGCCVAM